MGIARSTYYDAPAVRSSDGELLEAITAICDEFEAYGWRRVKAALRHRGVIANHKRIKRLMREHDLQPHRRRRYAPGKNFLRATQSILQPKTTRFLFSNLFFCGF